MVVCVCAWWFVVLSLEEMWLILVDNAKQLQLSYLCNLWRSNLQPYFVVIVFTVISLLFVVIVVVWTWKWKFFTLLPVDKHFYKWGLYASVPLLSREPTVQISITLMSLLMIFPVLMCCAGQEVVKIRPIHFQAGFCERQPNLAVVVYVCFAL